MPSEETKKRLFAFELMIVAFLAIFIGVYALNKFLPTAQVPISGEGVPIVGFVSIKMESQQMSISAIQPTTFVLFSEKDQAFNMTSLRFSGEVIGKGRAEITLDNGLGQELLVYSNVRKRQGNMITGMATATEEVDSNLPEGVSREDVTSNPQALIKMTLTDFMTDGPSRIVDGGREILEEKFEDSCIDTCYINMKMQKGLYYKLKLKIDPDTEIKLTKLTYMLEI